MPKTGSSAIQAFLAKNNDCIKRYNYIFPWHPGFGQAYQTSAGNATKIHELIMNGENETIENLIDSLDEDNVILSSEVLFHTARLKPKEFCDAFSKYDFKVICYIRKIDDLIDSCANQLVKNHNLKNCEDLYTIVDDHNYAQTLVELSKFVGVSRIDIRVYDRTSFKGGSIYSDILSSVDLDKYISESELESPDKVINPSLNPESFELRRLLNFLDFDEMNSQEKYFLNGLLARYSIDHSYKYSILSKKERKSVFDYFLDDETLMSKIFFGKEGRLFDDITDVEKADLSFESIFSTFRYLCDHIDGFFNKVVSMLSRKLEDKKSEQFLTLSRLVKLYISMSEESIILDDIMFLYEPCYSILPYSFDSYTYGFSNDIELGNRSIYRELISTGTDPYFLFDVDSLDGEKVFLAIISMESDIDCVAQFHYQTTLDPFFGNKKFKMYKVKKGHNVLVFRFHDEEFNGNLRFDPIMDKGNSKIYSISIYK